MQNFRKLPAMKRKIDENIKKLMEKNLRYYVQKEYGIDAGFKK